MERSKVGQLIQRFEQIAASSSIDFVEFRSSLLTLYSATLASKDPMISCEPRCHENRASAMF